MEPAREERDDHNGSCTRLHGRHAAMEPARNERDSPNLDQVGDEMVVAEMELAPDERYDGRPS